jgi:hypothetical protein
VCALLALATLAHATDAPAGHDAPGERLDARREAATPAPLLGDPRLDPDRRAKVEAGGLQIDRWMTTVRLGCALAGLVLLGWGAWLAGRGRGSEHRMLRRGALLVVALLAFGASYNFFAWSHYYGIHGLQVFHYYVGSKYFPEVGYFDLYECAVVSLHEDHPERAHRSYVVRDLRDIDQRKSIVPARFEPRCNGAFEPSRWAGFKKDVRFFVQRMPPDAWQRVTVDQGFNASPIWVLFGRSLAELFPTEPDAMRWLVRTDLLLLALMFGAAAWGFGFEGMCLVVIAWAANPLSRYQWIGDSVLRQFWIMAAVVGLCLLKRGWHASSGAFLALASLVRVFPILYAISYAAGRLQRWRSEGTLDRSFVDFVAAGIAASLVLIGAATWVGGRGYSAHVEFASNVTAFSDLTGQNSVGLRPLLSYSSRMPVPVLVDGELIYTDSGFQDRLKRTFASRWWIYYPVVLGFLGLYYLALRRARDWEAACMGFVLILVLTQAPSYYMTCTVAAALLGTARPRIAMALFATLAVWCAINLAWVDTTFGFAASSAVGLVFALYVLIEMLRASPESEPDAVAA